MIEAGAFDGKVALVTGAGGGIGLATAEAFASAGASVVLADHDAESGRHRGRGPAGGGSCGDGVTCDVTDAAQVAAMVERTVEHLWPARRSVQQCRRECEAAPLLDTSDDEFERVMGVNLRGVWHCMKAEFARWWRREAGRSSIAPRSAG